jgi:hypothetical protein
MDLIGIFILGSVGLSGYILLIVFLTIIITIIKRFRKRFNKQIHEHLKESEMPISIKEPEIEVPEICPHCKNPNTKKIRICEWCGNQII